MDLVLVAALTGAVVTSISVLFWNIRRSRCTSCKSPCCSIERELMSQESMREDKLSLPEVGL